jgi:hypothetical protein
LRKVWIRSLKEFRVENGSLLRVETNGPGISTTDSNSFPALDETNPLIC